MFSLLSALASMGPYFAPPLAALTCCLLPAGCCVICDSEVLAALKSLKTDFLPNFLNPEEVKHMYDTIVRTVKGFSDLPYNKKSYVGAIDEKTYRIVTKSFLKSLKNITDSRIKGKQSLEKLNEMFRNEKVTFAFHAAQFQRLGLMLQKLIWCDYCNFQIHKCSKPVDCGGRNLEIHELEELNLNCHLDWHDNAYGLADYTFYRVWENNSETELHKGKDPVLNKPSVSLRDAGNYRCVLRNTLFGTPSSIIRFHVTVFPRDLEEWKPSGDFAQNQPNKEEEEEETPSPTEAEPIDTTTQPLEIQNMLQGRINGLLICFSIILIAALIFWLLTRKKKKTKSRSSRASISSKGSRTSKRTSSKGKK
ncbi:izumo sperm-egg fusion protein 1-like isoform X2 [Sciurus carolinensis]|uniref:izumo sperm-egg fusion protein 1-like isoform X2 n=1 Tax=Sciurus carolinensis TaxID=30640 RepID=UPI001FB43BD4|nr:izumo sperm-egg fusion protein 1-like isoform X2 [Sciurus carolinensis]